jgi:hypothetical protein
MEKIAFTYESPRGRQYLAQFSNRGGWSRYEIFHNGQKVQFALDEKGVADSVEHYENPGPDISSRFD